MFKTTVGIDGMMCGMCEAHMNDAFRKAFDVKKVKASRKDKCAEIISETELDEEAVKKAVEETGYTFTSFSSEEYVKKGLFSK